MSEGRESAAMRGDRQGWIADIVAVQVWEMGRLPNIVNSRGNRIRSWLFHSSASDRRGRPRTIAGLSSNCRRRSSHNSCSFEVFPSESTCVRARWVPWLSTMYMLREVIGKSSAVVTLGRKRGDFERMKHWLHGFPQCTSTRHHV